MSETERLEALLRALGATAEEGQDWADVSRRAGPTYFPQRRVLLVLAATIVVAAMNRILRPWVHGSHGTQRRLEPQRREGAIPLLRLARKGDHRSGQGRAGRIRLNITAEGEAPSEPSSLEFFKPTRRAGKSSRSPSPRCSRVRPRLRRRSASGHQEYIAARHR